LYRKFEGTAPHSCEEKQYPRFKTATQIYSAHPQKGVVAVFALVGSILDANRFGVKRYDTFAIMMSSYSLLEAYIGMKPAEPDND